MMTEKVTGTSRSAPSIPACRRRTAKMLETAAATIPRGAIQQKEGPLAQLQARPDRREQRPRRPGTTNIPRRNRNVEPPIPRNWLKLNREPSSTKRLETSRTLRPFLELQDVLERDEPLVGQGDAQHGDREQPGLVLQQVGPGERGEDERERDGVLQVVGHPEPPEDQHEDGRRQQPDRAPKRTVLSSTRRRWSRGGAGGRPGRPRRPAASIVRADRVDDDPLPLEDRPDLPDRLHVPKERSDHGRPGDDQDRPQQQRQRPGQPRGSAGRRRSSPPT